MYTSPALQAFLSRGDEYDHRMHAISFLFNVTIGELCDLGATEDEIRTLFDAAMARRYRRDTITPPPIPLGAEH